MEDPYPTWRPSYRVGEAERTVWVVRGEGSPVNPDHIGVVWGKQLRALDFLRKPQKWLREQGDQTTSSWLGVGGCGLWKLWLQHQRLMSNHGQQQYKQRAWGGESKGWYFSPWFCMPPNQVFTSHQDLQAFPVRRTEGNWREKLGSNE